MHIDQVNAIIADITVSEMTSQTSLQVMAQSKGFADLPGELRNEIYKYMLEKAQSSSIAAAIFGSCRVARREYLPLYFERNTVDLTFDQLAQFLPMLIKNGFTTFVDGECCVPNMQMRVSHGRDGAVNDVKWLIALLQNHPEVTIHFDGNDFIPRHASNLNNLFHRIHVDEDSDRPARDPDTIAVDITTLKPSPVLRPAYRRFPLKWLAWPVWKLRIEHTMTGPEALSYQPYACKKGHEHSDEGLKFGGAAALNCGTCVRKTHISVKLGSKWTSAPLVGPARWRQRRYATRTLAGGDVLEAEF